MRPELGGAALVGVPVGVSEALVMHSTLQIQSKMQQQIFTLDKLCQASHFQLAKRLSASLNSHSHSSLLLRPALLPLDLTSLFKAAAALLQPKFYVQNHLDVQEAEGELRVSVRGLRGRASTVHWNGYFLSYRADKQQNPQLIQFQEICELRRRRFSNQLCFSQSVCPIFSQLPNLPSEASGLPFGRCVAVLFLDKQNQSLHLYGKAKLKDRSFYIFQFNSKEQAQEWRASTAKLALKNTLFSIGCRIEINIDAPGTQPPLNFISGLKSFQTMNGLSKSSKSVKRGGAVIWTQDVLDFCRAFVWMKGYEYKCQSRNCKVTFRIIN